MNAEKKDQAKKDPYRSSRLRDWLELATWESKEAVCLLCDIDPTGTDIHWDGFTNIHGGHVDAPKVERGQLLTEGRASSFDQPGDRFLDVSGHEYDPWFRVDDIESVIGIDDTQSLQRHRAEMKLRKVWSKYSRNPNHQSLRNRPPHEYIEWAISEGVDIPWLEWAIQESLVDLAKDTRMLDRINQNSLHSRERNTLLVLIAALCRANSIDYERRGIAKQLVGLVDEIGMSISDDTVRKILKDIPQALD